MTTKVTEPEKPRKPKPKLDEELQAMARIDRLLSELSDEASYRVIGWLRDRHPYSKPAEPGLRPETINGTYE